MFGYNDSEDLLYLRQMTPGRLLIFYVIFFVGGEGLRWFVRNNVRRKHQSLMLDLTAAFSLYGCTVGNNYVYRIYGPICYLMATAAVGVGHALLLCPGVTANPVTHIISCIVCDNSCQKVALRLGAQVTGSLVCHPFATLLWQTLMADLSVHELDRPMHCMDHDEVRGQSVHVAMVFAIELLGTLVVCLPFMTTCQMSIDIYETAAKVFIGCLLNGAGMNNPAIYLNPILANSQLLGCSNSNVIEHVMVYWFGPVVGASVAVYSTICTQETQRKLSGPCVTFNECPTIECSQPCRLPDNNDCKSCDSKSRSNSSRPYCKLSDDEGDEYVGECCEEPDPCACRPKDCGITAQVRQTAVNGSKQLAYLFDIPPSVCQKGLRLRHNILVTKKPKCSSELCCNDWRDSSACDWRNFSPNWLDSCSDTPPEDWRRSCYEETDQARSPERESKRQESRRPSSKRSSRENSPDRQGSRRSSKPRKSRSKTSKMDLWRRSSRNLVADMKKTQPEPSQSKHAVRKGQSKHSVGKDRSSKSPARASETKESLKKEPSRRSIDRKSQPQEKQAFFDTIQDSKSLAKVTPSKKSQGNVTQNKKLSTSESRPSADKKSRPTV